MKRYILVLLLLLVVVMIVVPALMVAFFHSKGESGTEKKDNRNPITFKEVKNPSELNNQIAVSVYRTKKDQIERLPIESYVAGVVAAEMPSTFELEALKAQAMAARTYIIRRLAEKDFDDVANGAQVTDTIQHQVYLDQDQLKERWGSDYSRKMNKIFKAVIETSGKVITYKGRPINATFFSTSNGYTENSEEYWLKEIPYLRSTKSPWDKNSPKFIEQTKLPLKEFEKKLGVDGLAVEASTGQSWSQVLDYTTGKRVARVKVGDSTFTGREVRELLGLNSASFSWEIKGDTVWITTKGYGHGVGMSQWGANGMAKQGKAAEAIVEYYYKGTKITDYHQWVK